MAVTIKDIAQRLGVSEATVSLACNNSPLVNKKTKEKILEAVNEMGYMPNMIAKSLATSKSNTIGIIIPDINILFYADLLREMDRVVNMYGYSLIMAMSNNDPDIEEKIIRSFIEKRIEGVLVVPTNKPTQSLWAYQKALKDHDIPIVYLTSIYGVDRITFVMSDLEEGTYQLTNYLLEKGHKDIIFVGGDKNVPTTYLRRNGFLKALTEHGQEYNDDTLVSCTNIHYSEAFSATIELLEQGKHFSAVCAMNDEMALGVFNALYNSGLRVPEDVSVVGYDNTLYSQISLVGITTMDQNLEQMCIKALETLLDIIKNNVAIEKHIYIKPLMIERGSVANKS